jgi:formylglycine-generating enzyme required for sulfatase activity/tRNA A-37 threonylcarbamoyl transferase component Bud32
MADNTLTAGSVLGGDFEIVEPLASGGMGAVYVARQRSTGATRALKTMHAHLVSDADFRKRFTQEATICTQIASEHVVQVVAAGIDDQHSVPWIAMEYLRGENLEAFVTRKGRLSLEEMIEVFLQVGHAVGAAHRAGIVHRDLKPENIFISPSQRVGEAFTVKVLDFGIAKIRSASDSAAKQTSALGTPLWMAPEQLRMTGDIDARADVWALGLIAFYCLTGKSFWRAGTAEDVDLAALVNEIAYAPLSNASVRASEVGAPGVPTAIRSWFERCVERDRERRFPDAKVALEGLLFAAKNVESLASTLSPASITGIAIARTSGDTARSPFDMAAPRTSKEQRFTPAQLMVGLVAVGGLCFFALARTQPEVAVVEPPHAAAPTSPAAAAAPLPAKDDSPMVIVAGGVMDQGRADGPADEGPTHRVSVASFRMDAHEVTVAAYEACVARGACTPAGTDDECNSGHPDRANHPINCVDFVQASAYCTAHGERLPTEEEWEFAAREDSDGLYPWGKEAPTSEHACFQRVAAGLGTCPIMSHPKGQTRDGIHDLAGNVWEWTDTTFCTYDRKTCDPSMRMARGGSYSARAPEILSGTVRMAYPPSTRGAILGFRCVKTR